VIIGTILLAESFVLGINGVSTGVQCRRWSGMVDWETGPNIALIDRGVGFCCRLAVREDRSTGRETSGRISETDGIFVFWQSRHVRLET